MAISPESAKIYNTAYQQSFSDRLRDGVARGYLPNKTQEARDWYRKYAELDQTVSGDRIGAESHRIIGGAPFQAMRTMPRPGNMYMYYYDPKWAKKLPLYDIFPCTIIYQMTPDGFYGLNLHYLPHWLRAKLMDALYPYVSDQQYDEKTQFTFTYPILKASGQVTGFQRCIKRYLYPQVRSRFLYITPAEWDIAIMLPLEKFSDFNVTLQKQETHGHGIRRGEFK